ncbi:MULTISPECIES: PBP1A family penicillin-binding protein [Methylobacterium]|jgi:penicillin-binding protein 1A|uniref:transglycosylase domain-containing protein n=2 Tax=Methylobacteriaceae TaxID=119045 RepID=UPI0008F0591D|nr:MULTISPECIES: PBP1A family penicillin-binding protein [Methylobacterium]MBK3395434.1 PBP1A family penicillin-binding protein [Methylobacterium ajmalii]MBK3410860.1 PBP1A family penicillin-binding protein [Methylobacterium ajmalii]MBZ6412962.1 PBP1A family penicillin-binding protein [Methylobacterium sp.]SFE97676.1 penicillin-binding protein 1A [Methylobacterium sp. yr596]
MAKGRERTGRVEPRFEAEGTGDPASLDLRLSRGDRAGGGVAKGTSKGTSKGSAKAAPKRAARAAAPAPRRRRRSFLGSLVYGTVILGLWGLVAVAGIVAYHASQLPPIDQLAVPKRPPNIAILAADGSLLANRGETGGRTVSIRELPPYLPRAFVAIEDRRFYSHLGIDPVGIARAISQNLTRRGVAQGGSTLTQQLAKNLFLTQERTASRKIQEAILALWLEHKYTKDEILELYLNRVYFGAGAYGVEAAAQRYFAKPAKEVTLAEAAMLGGLVQAPSRLAPNRNLPAAQARAAQVLAAMQELGFAKPADVKVALAQPAKPARAKGGGSANYVADLVMDVLDDYVGKIETDVSVQTTVDPGLQAVAERSLVDELNQKGGRYNVGQGAVVTMRPDGAIRALIGGRDYAQSQFNRATTAKRQPGSAFKPFVYLAAVERGLTPDTVREDAPINIKGWNPENYSRNYSGPVTLRDALAHSLNTVAVRLGVEVGPKAVVQTAQRLGITSALQANASIALGTSEVTPLELVGAYATFANGGMGVIPYVIAGVKTVDGRTVYKRAPSGLGRVIEPQADGMMNAMMHEVFVSGTAKKGDIPGWDLAGKTGTSQDFRDAWVIGYSATLVTGVWLGNDDGEPTKRVSGGNLPVEIWNRVMVAGLRGDKPAPLPGAARWRRTSNAVAAANPAEPPTIGGMIDDLLGGGQPAPARPQPAPQRGGPSREDKNFLERLFGIGE